MDKKPLPQTDFNVSVKDLAETLNCSAQHIRTLIRSAPQTMPKHIRTGKRIAFSRASVIAYLERLVGGASC